MNENQVELGLLSRVPATFNAKNEKNKRIILRLYNALEYDHSFYSRNEDTSPNQK